MKRLRWEIIVLLCVVMLSGQVHAAVSISANLTGPATVNEGQYRYYTYGWTVTESSGYASRVKDGTLFWNFGDGNTESTGTGVQYLSDSLANGYRYADEGTYQIQASSTSPLRTANWHNTSSWGGPHWDYYGDVAAPTRTLAVTVLNVAPTIQSMTAPLTVDAGVNFAFSGHATDPGINDILTYSWDLDNDGAYDDAVGASGVHNYAAEGLYTVGLRVGDGDGGFDHDNFSITVIPEPAIMGMMGVFAVGLWGFRRIFPVV